MGRDEESYKDPLLFNPDRYMGPNPERDPADFIFGFGRRCVLSNYHALGH